MTESPHGAVYVCTTAQDGYNRVMPEKHPIEHSSDIRTAILSALHDRDATAYGFAKAVSEAGITAHHTVDAVLAPPESLTHATPTLPTAIALLDAAGYDLIAIRRREGIKITAKRRR